MKTSISRWLFPVITSFAFLTPQVLAGSRTVDCDAGASLQSALESGIGSAAMLEISLSGTCYENLTINRDRVEISGDGSSSIVGNIRVFGSDNVVLRDLTITGPGDGISIFNSRVRMFSVQVTGNDGNGITVDQAGSIRVRGGEISFNDDGFGVLVRGAYAHITDTQIVGNVIGIRTTNGSTLLISGGAVEGNGVHGIEALANSSVSVSETVLSDNGAYGLFLDLASSAEIHGATIKGNSGEGVEAVANSSVNIHGGSIFNNGHHGVSLILHSVARLFGVQIFGNGGYGAYLSADAGLIVDPDTSIPPNNAGYSVACDGKESSVTVNLPAFVPVISCPDADF